jgi:hypothetical protein
MIHEVGQAACTSAVTFISFSPETWRG